MDFSKYENLKVNDEKYNIWYETVKEVASFMGESKQLGKWQFLCKGKKHYELTDMMKLCRTEGKNPQALFNWHLKQ